MLKILFWYIISVVLYITGISPEILIIFSGVCTGRFYNKTVIVPVCIISALSMCAFGDCDFIGCMLAVSYYSIIIYTLKDKKINKILQPLFFFVYEIIECFIFSSFSEGIFLSVIYNSLLYYILSASVGCKRSLGFERGILSD